MKYFFSVLLLITNFNFYCQDNYDKKSNYPHVGLYLSEKYDNYIIVSVTNGTYFLDGYVNTNSCYGCKLESSNTKFVLTDSTWIDSLIYNGKRLSFISSKFKRITLKDSLKLNSDTVFFYAGLWYLTAARDSNNVTRKNSLLREAIPFFRKSISITKTEVNPYINLGLVYYDLHLLDSTKMYWDIGKKISPDNALWKPNYNSLSQLYLNDGLTAGANHDPNKAIIFFNKGIEADSSNAEIWYNLGGAYYTLGKMKEAKIAWVTTLKLNPDYIDAQRGLDAIPNSKKRK